MSLEFDPLTTIAFHSQALYDAADETDLATPVEHCPGWTVADLLAHVNQVHAFWATIVEGLLSEPPDDRAERPADDRLIASGREQATRLVDALAEADPSARCWTWAPQKDVAFVLRHQVQEAAVHHFDAAHAAGLGWEMDPVAAADAVSEFLTFSVSDEADVPDPPPAPLDGTFSLHAQDTGGTWTLHDGRVPGTIAFEEGPSSAPALEGSAAELLLWLYRRTELDTSAVPAELLARFDPLRFTD